MEKINSIHYKTDKGTTIAVNQIAELIEFLFPDPSPNVFTLADFRNRYKITGLGKRAIAAIEQSERINRNTGNSDQFGLCKFYVGLIYLYAGDHRGAIEQFRAACQKWEFGKNDLVFEAKALAHYAEGVAQQLVYHYEDALIAFSNAEHDLHRSSTWNASHEKAKEIKKILSAYIQKRQTEIHQALWQAESHADKLANEAEEHGAKGQRSSTQPAQPDTPNEGKTAPNPAVKQYFYTLPESIEYEACCQWYKVQKSNPDYLPQPEKGTLLLVDHQIEKHVCRENDLILVGTNNENLVVPVTPLKEQTSPFSRIHLTTPQLVGLFTRTPPKPVSLYDVREIPGSNDKIIGIVVGFWHPVNV